MYKLISKEEHRILKSKTDLSMSDLEWIMWEKSSVINYLRNIQTTYRMKLANLQAVGSEWEIYIAIKTIEEIIKWIDILKEDIDKIRQEEEKKDTEKT